MPGNASPEAVTSYYEHVDAEDYDAMLALFATDVTYDRPGQDPIEGLDALETFYREDRPLSEGSHEVLDVVVDDDQIAVRGRFEGTQGDAAVTFGFADFHTFDEDGDIVRRVTYTDRDSV